MKTKLKNVKPNPYRNIKHYPIRKDKVAALRESYRATGGVWPNIVARPVNGGVEIAYGHHRTAAAIEEYGPNHEIEIIDRKLDDAQMLKMMAHDNMEEYGTAFIVILETVKSVVEAFAAGSIKLEPIKTGTEAGVGRPATVRIAPSFIRCKEYRDADAIFAYTPLTVGRFLGWFSEKTDRGQWDRAAEKVKVAINALELIEKGILTEKQFYTLSLTQAEELVDRTYTTFRVRDEAVNAPAKQAQAVPAAQKVGKEIVKAFREQKEREPARQIARRVWKKIEKPKAIPDVAEFVGKLCRELDGVLSPHDELTEMILELLKVINDVPRNSRNNLYMNLMGLAKRAKQLASMVQSGKSIPQRQIHSLLRRS